jgi:hypothetical protein
VPDAYRLVTKGDGNSNTVYVLQGYFTWTQGWLQRGGEWRDLKHKTGCTPKTTCHLATPLVLHSNQPMTTATPLSPAAQAVLDACLDETCGDELMPSELRVIAAALRAAADQVVPDKPAPDVASLKEFERWDAKRFVRLQFLAIAAELEGFAAKLDGGEQ